MQAIKNSELFEMVARREISAETAAKSMLQRDVDFRRSRISAMRPKLVPRFAWVLATFLIIAFVDSLQRKA